MTAPATISLLTIPEAAEVCGGKVSEKAIRGAIINGALDAAKPGKAYLIHPTRIETHRRYMGFPQRDDTRRRGGILRHHGGNA